MYFVLCFFLYFFLYIYIYIYVWKLNQTVLELDFRAVKFFCSSLDGIWTHTIDTLQHHSLSLTSSALDHYTMLIFNLIYRAPTTFKLEGEVTSLSERSQGEVRDNREKWGDFWEKLFAINRNIVSWSLWRYPSQI